MGENWDVKSATDQQVEAWESWARQFRDKKETHIMGLNQTVVMLCLIERINALRTENARLEALVKVPDELVELSLMSGADSRNKFIDRAVSFTLGAIAEQEGDKCGSAYVEQLNDAIDEAQDQNLKSFDSVDKLMKCEDCKNYKTTPQFSGMNKSCNHCINYKPKHPTPPMIPVGTLVVYLGKGINPYIHLGVVEKVNIQRNEPYGVRSKDRFDFYSRKEIEPVAVYPKYSILRSSSPCGMPKEIHYRADSALTADTFKTLFGGE